MSTEQAMTSAEWVAFFLREDHEADKETPGPYEQGSGVLKQATFDEYWD